MKLFSGKLVLAALVLELVVVQVLAVAVSAEFDINDVKAGENPESYAAKPDSIKHAGPKQDTDSSHNSFLVADGTLSIECSKPVHNIHFANDLLLISKCEVITGSIIIKDYQDHVADLGNIGNILGDLVIKNDKNLQKLKGDGLQTIAGKMQLQELTSLSSLRFPSLVSVTALDWRVLPILTSVSFDTGIKHVESIVIADTSLSAFSGFDVDSLKTLNINNNRFLEKITTQVKKVTEELSIAANAKNVAVNLPSLTWANNITFRDVHSLDIKLLEEVEATVGFFDNNFEILKAPKLRIIGGTLIIGENKKLKEIEFPLLQEVEGGLIFLGNPQITRMSFFPKLQAIGGAIKFEGDFKDLSLPKLRLVKGSASIKTTSDSFNCPQWIRSEASAYVRGGKIECSADAKSSQTIHVDNNGQITSGIGSSSSGGDARSDGNSKVNLNKPGCLFSLLVTILIF